MPKHAKSAEQRAAEAAALEAQLREVPGLPDDVLQPLVAQLELFAATGQGFSGDVRVPGVPVKLVCLVSNQAHITSYIRITRRA